MSLDLSTVLSWSRAICPSLSSNFNGTLVGYLFVFVVMGAIITVDKECISFGEMTTQGLVFFISDP
jgi:hypothetical protein